MWQFNILEEPVAEMIEAITYNDNYYAQQLNIPNNGGLIPTCPLMRSSRCRAISGMGIQGWASATAGRHRRLCRRELELGSIIVEAAATGDRNLALQALLLDPMIDDLDTARAI